MFSPGAEIRAYFERVARRHGVGPSDPLRRRGHRCDFADGRWRLTTAAGQQRPGRRGDRRHRRAPPSQVPRHRRGWAPSAVPPFHSARWDHGVPLDGARVGIVGTGSTAVQIVSAVVDRVRHLALFQRTAQWIMPQENPPYTDEERADFAPGPRQLAELHQDLSDCSTLRQCRGRRRVAADEDDRAGVPGQPRGERGRSRSCASSCARLPGRPASD